MAQTPTKEELVKKYGEAFKELEDLTFGVPFPDKQKYVLRLLTPHQYRKFVAVIQDGLKGLLKTTQTKFEIYDKPHDDKQMEAKLLKTISGTDVTRSPKPQWETNEDGSFKKNKDGNKIPIEDEYGQQIMVPFTNIRIEVAPYDIQEYAANKVKRIPPKNREMIKAVENTLWGNAETLLQILFPTESQRFNQQYVDTHLNIPFMFMLFKLVVDMNNLDFLVPFVKDMFPMISELFPQKETEKQSQ